MKILLCTYFFHPQATPRAFRAFELAKELARRGHDVTVYAADCGDRTDFSSLGFRVRRVASGFLLNRAGRVAAPRPGVDLPGGSLSPRPAWRNAARAAVELFYPGGFTFEYAFTLWRTLRREEPQRPDLLISIGLPVGVHFGAAWYRGAARAGVFVADYGDPFSNNQEGRRHAHYRLLERAMLRRFDHVTVPIEAARSAYEGLFPAERIHVVPQGVDFSIARRESYVPGPVVNFAYAGVFYAETRHPGRLFEALAARQVPFKFTIFTNLRDTAGLALIDPWRQRLGARLVLKDMVPRAECIRLMSTFDFLVNQRFATGVQSPSKLIDYGLAGRPVFTFDQHNLDETRLDRFLARDFSDFEPIDLSCFDVRNVASQFEALAARPGSPQAFAATA